MERVTDGRTLRKSVLDLTSYAKEICSFFTSTTPRLSVGDSITKAHMSTITDIIILLRYVEIDGVMRCGIAVIKMRGLQHAKEIHEFTISDDGLHIGHPFQCTENIVLGVPTTSLRQDTAGQSPDSPMPRL